MSREFENNWKDAFEGASITPSEKVWASISSKMDSGHGRKSWVTMLLIAATVTVAFAFPLTVGNSEYKLKPQAPQLASSSSPVNTAVNPINDLDGSKEADRTATDNVYNKSAEKSSQVGIVVRNNNVTTPKAVLPTDQLLDANAEGLIAYQPLQLTPGSGLDEYYILPAYKIKTDNFDRNILAFGNLNSGRQSASSSLTNMNMLSNAADFEQAPGFSNSRDFANGSEDGGATFYVGLGAEIPVGKRLNLTAGVGYQNQRLNGTSNIIFEENGQQHPIGIYDPVLPGSIFLSESYDYISNNQFVSVPLGAKYALVNKRVKFRLGLGLSPDFMLSHKVSSSSYGTNSTKLADTAYNTIQVTGLFNLDVSLPLHANYGLAFETGLRQGLVPFVENGSEYATSFNFGVILFYQLRK